MTEQDFARGAEPLVELPGSPLPLLPMRTGVLFPGANITVPVGRPRSLALIEAVAVGDIIAVAVQRERQTEAPRLEDLHPVATLARLRKVVRLGDGHFRLALEGLRRCEIIALTATDPYCLAELQPVHEVQGDALEATALAEELILALDGISTLTDEARAELSQNARAQESPARTADVIAAGLSLPSERELVILNEIDVGARLRLVHQVIAEIKAVAEIRGRIHHEVHQELSKGQRQMLLRQQLRAIKKELGEEDGGDKLGELRKKIEAAGLPAHAGEAVEREMARLESLSPEQPEHNVIRKYLELIAELPWSKRAEVKEDLDAVAQKLDADHFGLAEVKKRILEHLAVRKLTGNKRGAILCLVGPPGVGKTSLGRSIADATGRPFVRVSLGGARDEADIRGHRRTYVAALPGRILAAMRSAKVKNPVLMLDEVDKLGQGWLGSPEAALLEVLDPEQNNSFTDHYLDLPFDLSEVLFIATGNTLETLSPALKDRLEVIEIEGYTLDEKLAIAVKHLLPKQLVEHGLDETTLVLSPEALGSIVADYTREAGVRQLGRELGKICRAVTLDVARRTDGKVEAVRPTTSDLKRYLGKVRFFNDVAERTSIPGVATGLAWTPAGGDILFIEATRMPGKGKLEITGQLGDVMKESARAALSFVRSHAVELGIAPDFFEHHDLHLHIPAGAVPKDGPSAGVALLSALASLLTGRRVRSDTAMTGEITLRGRALPVGGIKSKLLAAHRAGIKRVILPMRNERDLDELPEAVRAGLDIVLVEDLNAVLDQALEVSPTVLDSAQPSGHASASV